MRSIPALALLPILTLVTTSGCIVAKDEHFAISDDINLIDIRFEAGDIEVIGESGADQIVVDLEVGGLGFGDVGYTVEGETLIISGDCGRVSICGGEVTIITPPEVALLLDLGAGDVEISYLYGDVFAGVGAGDVEMSNLFGDEATALLGAGDLSLNMSDDFDSIWVENGAGEVELSVPTGGYQMTLDAGAGEIDLDAVADDSQATSSITVYTGAGEISIQGW